MNLKNLGQTSDMGLRTITGRRAGQGAVVGFTMPSRTFDRMRRIDASANALDYDIDHYLRGSGFQSLWRAWYEGSWKPVAQRYEIDEPTVFWNTPRLLELFSSDEFAAQIDAYEKDLAGWYERYAQQKRPSGEPVPPPRGAPPHKGDVPKTDGNGGGSAGSSLPWYFWMGLGIVGVGLGYVVYRQAADAYAVKRGLVRTLSAVRDPAPAHDSEGLPTLHDLARRKV